MNVRECCDIKTKDNNNWKKFSPASGLSTPPVYQGVTAIKVGYNSENINVYKVMHVTARRRAWKEVSLGVCIRVCVALVWINIWAEVSCSVLFCMPLTHWLKNPVTLKNTARINMSGCLIVLWLLVCVNMHKYLGDFFNISYINVFALI